MHYGSCEVILFREWKADVLAAFISSSLGLFFISILYEGIRYSRDYLFKREQAKNIRIRRESGKLKTNMEYMFSKIHLLQCCLHAIQVTIGYWLMLIFMQFNFWLIISILLGSLVGYYFFAWLRIKTFKICGGKCC